MRKRDLNLVFYMSSNNFIFYTLSSLLCLTILSCQIEKDAKRDIKSFYYPVEALKTPMVYVYHPVKNDTLGAQYWYFSTLETDTGTYLNSYIYNQFLELEQLSVEELVSNGVVQKDYFLYSFDSIGHQQRFPAEIEYGNTFPFEVKDSSGVFLQKMKWTFSQSPLHTITLIRNRRYIGDKKYRFKDTEYDAITFSLREVIDDFQAGHLETETSGIEVYAKGIGLVYHKKAISENLILEYELVDRYSIEEAEGKFKPEVN